ncbi:MAG: hypothetical protein RL111_1120 [Pseudomonadota bacterium]
MKFEELNLAPAILKAIRESGYESPTPVQAQAIPAVLSGQDVLAGAQTGTGKTAAFTLPILHRLSMSRSVTNRFGVFGIRALVLTPTRELAAQIEESVQTYGKHLQLKAAVIFGGVGQNPQVEALRRGVDILVATPGRLLDLAQQNLIDLSTVQVLVLDEADRMLDMGFIHDVRKVLALVPAEKQSLLFSATFSDEIRQLAQGLLRSPLVIQVTPKNTTVERIRQIAVPVGRNRKSDLLAHLIQTNNWSQVLVFTRTKFGANKVSDFLNAQGISAMALHGNKSQTARTQALGGFKTGDLRVLVATDIAARGIDIDELPHVVNYDIPNITEDYVHRIGRTGRAGSEGEAVSLVSVDEAGFMQEIERFIQREVPVVQMEGFGPEAGETAQPIAMGRQTLWGGLGKPPSRDAMAAASRAARQEMLQRIREKKTTQGGGERAARPARPHAPRPHAAQAPVALDDNGEPLPMAEGHAGGAPRMAGGQNGSANGDANRNRKRSRNRRRGGGGESSQPRVPGQPSMQDAPAPRDDWEEDDYQPRANAHLGTQSGVNAFGHKGNRAGTGQPDPTKTSIDLMSRKGGGGGGGGRNRHRSGGGGGGGGGGRRYP